ncbi:MAG: MOSC domain-containing protein [Sporichthyaceae bacterium]
MRVAKLLTTTVKGFALDAPHEVSLDPRGAAGDREFFCVGRRGVLTSITRTGRLCAVRARYDAAREHLHLRAPDGTTCEGAVVLGEEVPVEHFGIHLPGRLVDGPWNAMLSALAGAPLRLVRATGERTGSDLHPVTLLGESSIQAVAAAAGVEALDPRRFRMLINFDGAPPFTEDTWRGRRLRVGGAVIEVGGPVPRCAATLRNPDTGVVDLQVLAAIVKLRGLAPNEFSDRGINLGVYARVLNDGSVGLDDVLEEL